jgi:hypothetical protein
LNVAKKQDFSPKNISIISQQQQDIKVFHFKHVLKAIFSALMSHFVESIFCYIENREWTGNFFR